MELDSAVVIGYMSNYLLTLVFCLIGSFIRETKHGLQAKYRISLSNVIIGAIFSTFIALAIIEYVKIDQISIYAFVCVLLGMFGSRIAEYLVSQDKFIGSFIRNFLKCSSNIFIKSIGTALEESHKEEEKRKLEDDTNENDKGVGS